jgi:hypothetical protein
MSEAAAPERRLVAWFRSRVGGQPDLTALRALRDRLVALGATPCAFTPDACGFSIELDALESWVELVLDPELRGFVATLSEGEVTHIDDLGAGAAWLGGEVISVAQRAARLGDPGEVLVDASVSALRRGELLTRGVRRGRRGAELERAARLDLRWPLRSALGEAVTRLEEPAFIARDLFEAFVVEPATLSVLRAPRGFGGSRALAELGKRAGSRLALAPGTSGEPLGALRHARERAWRRRR